MILLRGIKGHEYAIKIKKGIVDFKDLFTTVVNTNNTGYKFSNYYEKYFAYAFNTAKHIAKEGISGDSKLQMALDDFVPYIYLTYFHIMNEKSEQWVESFDDDFEFIYYIPKLDSLTNQLIDRDFFGAKIQYVDEINENLISQKRLINYGLMTKLDGRSLTTLKISSVVACVYNMLLYPLFFRVRDSQFNEFEQEFRLFHIDDCYITEKGNVQYKNPRKFNLNIDGVSYWGEVMMGHTKMGIIDQKHMLLKPQSALTKQEVTFLTTTDSRTAKIEYKSQFKEIKLSGKASSGYGYIGGKKECIEFIRKQQKESFYYANSEYRKILNGKYIQPEKFKNITHFMPPWQYIDYRELNS